MDTNEKKVVEGFASDVARQQSIDEAPLDATPKSRWERSWPVIACGAGLFSDGYLNGVIGSVNTMLKILYKDDYVKSHAQNNVSSIAFVGTVVGQLIFGYLSDHWSRRHSLLISTFILIVFAALGAGSYGAGAASKASSPPYSPIASFSELALEANIQPAQSPPLKALGSSSEATVIGGLFAPPTWPLMSASLHRRWFP